MSYLLLHNPRCTKSRDAFNLLKARGDPFDVRLYLEEPLSLDELRILRKRMGRPVGEWLRWGEDAAKKLDREASDIDLLKAMAANPKLMERPILINGDKAAVGRPGMEPIRAIL